MLDFCKLAISRISSKQSDFTSDVHVKREMTQSVNFAKCLFFFLDNSLFSSQHTLHFWLEQGVAGIAICSTDAAYSEQVKKKRGGGRRYFSDPNFKNLIFFFFFYMKSIYFRPC